MIDSLSPEDYWNRVEATGMAYEWTPKTLVMTSYRDGLKAAVLGIPTDVNTVRWAKQFQKAEEENKKLRRALVRITGSFGLIIKGARANATGNVENYENAKKVIEQTSPADEK